MSNSTVRKDTKTRIFSGPRFRHRDTQQRESILSDPTPELQKAIAQSRKEFVATAAALRPRLHRFCTRMCGSVLDGEDVVQEALAEAFYTLPTLRDSTRFEPWIFRIAYHKSIDFVRRNKRRQHDTELDDASHAVIDVDDDLSDAPIDEALAMLVGELPAKERAAVILKDVLDYPLTEVADIADTTVGGAKAALHRGRSKLRESSVATAPAVAAFDRDQRRLFNAYAECFNRRDWEGLKHLVRADARLEIVGENEGAMSTLGATYSGNYTRLPHEWRLSAAIVDGTPAVLHWRRTEATWEPYSAIRLWWENGEVVRIRDYIHVGYLLAESHLAAEDKSSAPG
ncbi:MAG TPA: RNA polymerase sigma factor [Gemmatimonadaceae bacterium]